MMKKHIILFSSVLVFSAAALTIGGSEVRAEGVTQETIVPIEEKAKVKAAAEFYDNNNIGYSVTNATTKEVAIVTHRLNGLSENLVIPEKVSNDGIEYTVTEVADQGLVLFSDEKDTVKSVTIPKSIKRVGRDAFYKREMMESVTFSEGLSTIGINAFSGTGLKSISLPSTLITIDNQAFMGCESLTNVTMKEGIETIGTFAFQNCTTLKAIVIPNSVNNLGAYAFNGNKSLSSAVLPANITKLSRNLFFDCVLLKTINIPDTVTSIEDQVFEGSGLVEVRLPEGITVNEAFGYQAFFADHVEKITFTSAITTGIATNIFKAPIKEGFIFDGWSGSNGESYLQSELSTPARKGDITLTAKWKQDTETPKPSTGTSEATIKLLEKQAVGSVSFGAISTDAKMVFKEIVLDGTSKTTVEDESQSVSKVKVNDTRTDKSTGWKVGVNYKDTNYLDKKMNVILKGTSANASVVNNVSIDQTKKNLFTSGTAKAENYEVKLNPTLTIPASFEATGSQTTQIEWTLEMEVE